MARVLFIAASALALAVLPAQAQERAPARDPGAGDARAAGLRYLSWPGRPPIQPARAATPAPDRAPAPAPRPVPASRSTPSPAPTPVVTALAPPPAPASAPAPAPASAQTALATSDTAPQASPGVRYYSLHRQAGREPDPLPPALTTGREEITVTLAAPAQPSLAERDRVAAGQETLELLRGVPAERLARLLESQP